jgi:nitrite reductase/ring-hydroxylating ferredoxin subunit
VTSGGESTVWRGDALLPGQATRFRLKRRGRDVEAFLVNWEGEHHAYVNQCPHAGTTLDLWPNEFFTEDGRHLICATHGAIFSPATGVCVEGPCPGARLPRLSVTRAGDAVIVSVPP